MKIESLETVPTHYGRHWDLEKSEDYFGLKREISRLKSISLNFLDFTATTPFLERGKFRIVFIKGYYGNRDRFFFNLFDSGAGFSSKGLKEVKEKWIKYCKMLFMKKYWKSNASGVFGPFEIELKISPGDEIFWMREICRSFLLKNLQPVEDFSYEEIQGLVARWPVKVKRRV